MGYFRMNDEMIDKYGKQLGAPCLGLYTYLSRRADKKGQSFPSIKTIMKDLGIGSYNTVNKYIKKLEKLGLLIRWKKLGKKYQHYQYQIMNRPPSKNDNKLTQKVNTKEYTNKENSIKEYKKTRYKQFLYGTWQEINVYKFDDGYKVLSPENKFVPFGGELNEIKKTNTS